VFDCLKGGTAGAVGGEVGSEPGGVCADESVARDTRCLQALEGLHGLYEEVHVRIPSTFSYFCMCSEGWFKNTLSSILRASG
jgi:hypothetical protein